MCRMSQNYQEMMDQQVKYSLLVTLYIIVSLVPDGISEVNGNVVCPIISKYLTCNGQNVTDFPTLPLDLERINLQNNLLSGINRSDLAGITQLSDLNLSDNMINVIEEGAFDDLELLRFCDLSRNSIQILPGDLFQKTKIIKSIRLRSNLLSDIKAGLFDGLQYLEIIDLTFNLLETIPWGLFDNLPSWQQILIHSNPYRCDCYIRYLYEWVTGDERFRTMASDVPVCADTKEPVSNLPAAFFEKCEGKRIGDNCDIAHTCQQKGVCDRGRCVCPDGYYYKYIELTDDLCFEVFVMETKHIVGLIVGIIAFLVMTIAVSYFVAGKIVKSKREAKRREKKSERMKKLIVDMHSQKSDRNPLKDAASANLSNRDIYLQMTIAEKGRNRRIPICDFISRSAVYHRDTDLLFAQEWEDIMEETERFTFLEAICDQNKPFNRDLGYVPYDKNRVKLEKESNGSDYINASFITGSRSGIDYIATQSPMPRTVVQFWQMVWEQDVELIVDVSYDCEDDYTSRSNKHLLYTKYCPDQPTIEQNFGAFKVETVSTIIVGASAVRHLNVTHRKETRTITQCQLREWKTFQLERCQSVVEFVYLVWSNAFTREDLVAKVVHCGCGSGRTGVFIALDQILQEIDNKQPDGFIDIYDLVMRLRNERVKIIETEEQYIFIYECVKKHLEMKWSKGSEDIEENIYSEYLELEDY